MRWLRHAWATVQAWRLHRRALCAWCREYLELDGQEPELTELGQRVHAGCLDDADDEGMHW